MGNGVTLSMLRVVAACCRLRGAFRDRCFERSGLESILNMFENKNNLGRRTPEEITITSQTSNNTHSTTLGRRTHEKDNIFKVPFKCYI